MKNGAHPEPETVLPQGLFNDDSVPHSGALLLGPHMESLSQTTLGSKQRSLFLFLLPKTVPTGNNNPGQWTSSALSAAFAEGTAHGGARGKRIGGGSRALGRGGRSE